MTDEIYDYIFITNIPSFYKINLFNLLSVKMKVKVIFISSTSLIRNSDFTTNQMNFDYEVINEKPFELRSKIKTLWKIKKIISKSTYRNLVYPGWEIIELMLLSIISPKNKNGMVIESSIIETRSNGFPWLVKRFFMSRMGKAFPSGDLQKEILYKASFKGAVYATHGVGVLGSNFFSDNEKNSSRISKALTYIYVGRLSSEKNVEELINNFNVLGNTLYVVGDGPMAEHLKNKANQNIKFLGHVNNSDLHKIYRMADVFILPSLSEPWGLVVEEALTSGLPLIVSDRVGCKNDLVIALGTGIVFSVSNGGKTMIDAILEMNSCFNHFQEVVNKIDFSSLEERKIDAYIDAL